MSIGKSNREGADINGSRENCQRINRLSERSKLV